MPVVLDTAFLIDLARGDAAARETLRALADEREQLLVPTVVLAEYLAGGADARAALDLLRAAAELTPFTADDAVAAGEIAHEAHQAGRFPGWADVMIAASARTRGDLAVVTRNGRRFARTRAY